MHALRRHRHAFARLVAMVLLLTALAPAVSRGLAFVQDRVAPWTQVCTAGTSVVGEQMAGGNRASHLLQHCPLCLPGIGDAPAWPAGEAAPRVWPPAPGAETLPAWRHAPKPLPVWAATRARAPPRAA